MILKQIHIISYRSIVGLKIDFTEGQMTTLCGANNVGKTNILRAINGFFKMSPEYFDSDDIPNHVERGSRGSSRKVDIKAILEDDSEIFDVSLTYVPPVDRKSETFSVSAKKRSKGAKGRGIEIPQTEAISLVSKFRVFFVEANKTDINSVIQEIFVDDILPTIDRARAKKRDSLTALENFQTTTTNLLKDVEQELSKNLESFTMEVEGISAQNWKIEIPFPTLNTLRNTISRLVTLTVNDANDKTLEFKGSGVQKVILLAIMRYVSNKGDKDVLWLIDEPETFLQPSLQREVFGEFSRLANSFPIVVTTHSPQFVELEKLTSTYLVEAVREPKEYSRKSTKKYMAVFTQLSTKSGFEKVEEIRNHLGIQSNDSWILTPYNLIVEGEEDKKYISTFLKKMERATPNILIAGGVSKIKAFAQFVDLHAKDMQSPPRVLCVFDHDNAGIEAFRKLDQKSLRHIIIEKLYVNRSNGSYEERLRFEMEDMLPLDLILFGANSYLSRRKYLKISQTALNSRYQAAKNPQSILDILTTLSENKNPSKEKIHFTSTDAKLFMTTMICDKILSMGDNEFSDILINNTGLKDFLDSIAPST